MMKSILEKIFGRRQDYPRQSARIPQGMTVYAIGDIHGELSSLQKMLDFVGQRAEEDYRHNSQRGMVIFLGDYVDRGPESRAVIELLSGLEAAWRSRPWLQFHFLKGNHEDVLLDFLQRPAADWLRFGGMETLASYGLTGLVGNPQSERLLRWRQDFELALPLHHVQFLQSLRAFMVVGDYLFVHAGVMPGIAFERQDEQDLLWIREPFLSSPKWHGWRVVHGHSIVAQPEVFENRIGIDTGAYGGIAGGGALTAAILCDDHVAFVKASTADAMVTDWQDIAARVTAMG